MRLKWPWCIDVYIYFSNGVLSKMNIIKKIYCRAFQTCFRIALPFLPYRNPEIKKHLSDVRKILLKEGAHKPLIITDETIRGLGLSDPLTDGLKADGIEYEFFSGAFPNPSVGLALGAYGLYKSSGCDSLIAIGGGSYMDLAKAVGIKASHPNKDLTEFEGILKVKKRLPLLIAIPTTAGTGSETSLACLLTDEKTKHKFSINDFPLIPGYAVLDYTLIHSAPRKLMISAGLDALTHAVEAYIGHTTNNYTRQASEKAVMLIYNNLDDAINHISGESEENMLVAANYAGRAFTRSYVGYVHALSHALSGMYELPHGWTNATLFPVVLKAYGETVVPALAKLSICAGCGVVGESDASNARRFIKSLEDMNKKYGIPAKISQIRKKDIRTLARFADREANPLYPVPKLMDAKELSRIYLNIMDET